MPISLECPGCGAKYQVGEHLAGKQARCKCGAALQVPSGHGRQAGAAPEGPVQEGDDWVAAAFDFRADAPAQPPRGPSHAPPAAAAAPPIAAPPVAGATPVRPAPPPPPPVPTALPPSPAPEDPAAGGPKRKKPWWKRAKIQRRVVGISALVYGPLFALAVLVFLVFDPPDGLFDFSERLAKLVLAALIALGGGLILEKHKHGPACAGLACLFLCFFPAWRLALNALTALTVGQLLPFVVFVVGNVVLYGVPVVVTLWSLREETARQEREAQEEPYR